VLMTENQLRKCIQNILLVEYVPEGGGKGEPLMKYGAFGGGFWRLLVTGLVGAGAGASPAYPKKLSDATRKHFDPPMTPEQAKEAAAL